MRHEETSRRQRHWDLRAAGNFIGGGSGSALIMVTALWALLPASNHAVARVPLLAGMGLVAAGLTLVWFEIGKPWRALNVFFHPQTSWMTREGMVAGPLLLAAAAAAWLGNPWALLPAALLAGAFLYCQARMLRASKAIPAWSHPRTVWLIVGTALAEGSGLFVLLGNAGSRSMIALALACALAREILRESYRRGLVQVGAPAQTLAWFTHPATRGLQAVRFVAAALLLLALVGAAGPFSALVAAVGGGLSALGGLGLKVILVTRAAFSRGVRVPFTPTRGAAGRGLLPGSGVHDGVKPRMDRDTQRHRLGR